MLAGYGRQGRDVECRSRVKIAVSGASRLHSGETPLSLDEERRG